MVSAGVRVPSVVRGRPYCAFSARPGHSPPACCTAARRVTRTSGTQTRITGVVVWDLEGVCPQTGCPSLPLPATETLGRLLGPHGSSWTGASRAASPWGEGARCSFSGCARPTVLAHPFFPARAPGCVLSRTAGEAPTLSTLVTHPSALGGVEALTLPGSTQAGGSLFWAGVGP